MHIRPMNRPEGNQGGEYLLLSKVMRRLFNTIQESQRDDKCRAIRLSKNAVYEMAEALTEFGEDLHNGIGLWATYEEHNLKCFGTPLPLTIPADDNRESQPGITEDRVRHFLWVLYPQVLRGLIIVPMHKGLAIVARAAAEELKQQFEGIPKESSIKRLLEYPNDYGWDVKRKLVWMGTKSYLFRLFYRAYKDDKVKKTEENLIGVTDDFICQECTEWSGLSANDLLASVLDISESDREDLRNWSFRHLSGFLVLSVGRDTMRVRNIVSDGEYVIRTNVDPNPFKTGLLVWGSLAPWRGEWYWSGMQQVYQNVSVSVIETLKRDFMRRNPRVIYRYCPDQAQIAQKRSLEECKENIARFGGPLAIFPDGLAFAAAIEHAMRGSFNALTPSDKERIQEKHGLSPSGPKVQLPDPLVKSKHQIGVFFNPERNMDIWDSFDELVSGLRNRVKPLPTEEARCIRGFVESESISPEFVRYITTLYGEQSIRAAYLLSDEDDFGSYCLEYLLRRFKGELFKKRHPLLSIY